MPYYYHSSGSVYLAVPSYGDMSPLTAFSLFKAKGSLGLLTGNCHVDDARNILVKNFLETDCETLVFIDADMGWSNQDLEKIASYEGIVGAAGRLKQAEEDYPVQYIGEKIWTDERGLIEVEGTGTAFLKIPRHVLQKLYDISEKFHIRSDRDIGKIFERNIINGGRVSGDYNFCRKARAIGEKIFVDPSIYLQHVGNKIYEGSLGSYLRRRNGLSLARGIELLKQKKETKADLIELAEDWGNHDFAAGIELLSACVDLSRQAKVVIEAGSGISSIMMAAANPNAEIHSLEHDSFWAEKAKEARLQNLHIHYAPLKNNWYRDEELPWHEADLIICDGPPRSLSDRDLILKKINGTGCVVFDDVSVPSAAMIEWAGDRYKFECLGKYRKFTIARKHGN